jgi:endonuclease/exonuclease/phosphatase family metal-dependent hydrolase
VVEVTVVEYNILHGFHTWREPFILEEQRLRACQSLLEEVNPDVIALTEAAFGAENPYGIRVDYQEWFPYPHLAYGAWGKEWGNCVLSRYPLESQVLPFEKRTLLRTQIDCGKTLNLDVVHTTPDLPKKPIDDPDQLRIDALENILPATPPRYAITGDFNALPDTIPYNRDLLISSLKGFAGDDAPRIVDNFLNIKFIPYLKSRGLIDPFAGSTEYTVPTDLLDKNKDSAMKMDHILHTPDIECLEARVIKDPRAEIISDHYGIWYRLRF